MMVWWYAIIAEESLPVNLTFNPCKGESYQAIVGYLRLTKLAKGR